jgi:rod shape-determining protein MreB and related proteins
MKLFNLFMQELAVDLGTANTLIMQDDRVVVDEPSIVAIDKKTGETIAVGWKAMQMHEKTHRNIETLRHDSRYDWNDWFQKKVFYSS